MRTTSTHARATPTIFKEYDVENIRFALTCKILESEGYRAQGSHGREYIEVFVAPTASKAVFVCVEGPLNVLIRLRC